MMNIFMSPKIVQKHSKTLFTGNIRKIPFSILIATQSKMHQSKKVNVKTLPRPYTIRKHRMVHSKMCHLGMQAGQTHSVKLGI